MKRKLLTLDAILKKAKIGKISRFSHYYQEFLRIIE